MFGLLPAAFRAFLKSSGASPNSRRKKTVNLKLKGRGGEGGNAKKISALGRLSEFSLSVTKQNMM